MGRVNDELARAIRTLHYEKYGGFYVDSEVLLDIKDTLYFRDRHIVEYDKLQAKVKDLEAMLVAEQGLSQFAIDLRENYYDTMGYTDNLNEVFDYYTSNKSLKMSNEEIKKLTKRIVKKIIKEVK
jgi:hypothetical protein